MPTTAQNFEQGKETQTEPYLLLLEFWQEFETFRHRAVLNNENVVFDGETYLKASAEISLPDGGETQSVPSITFSNVDRDIGRFALNVVGKIICRMIIVDGYDYTIVDDVRNYASAITDTLDMLAIASVEANVLTISGDLIPKLDMQIPYPINKNTPEGMPGLYL